MPHQKLPRGTEMRVMDDDGREVCAAPKSMVFDPFIVWNRVRFVRSGLELGMVFRRSYIFYYCLLLGSVFWLMTALEIWSPPQMSTQTEAVPGQVWNRIGKSHILAWNMVTVSRSGLLTRGGGTPLHGLNGDVRPDRVWISEGFVLNGVLISSICVLNRVSLHDLMYSLTYRNLNTSRIFTSLPMHSVLK